MEIVSLSPLPATIRPYQTARGAHQLLVVCKATFLLAPGTASLNGVQEPLLDDDKRWDDKPDRSVFASSDIVPCKRDVDVVLVGHAFAAGGLPVRSIKTRMCIGEIDKSIEAFVDRIFTPHGEMREGNRIARARLRYERAAGGPGTANPVGMRSDKKDAFGAIAVPSLQPVGLYVTRPDDLVEPVGYGPIAADWPSRVAWLGPYAATFSPARWYEAPLPEIDPAFFNVAPNDQRLREVRPDERIMLEGLCAEHPRLVTQLPGLLPQATVERASGHREPVQLRADTLWIDTTRRLCTVTWRASISILHPNEPGRVVVTLGSGEPSKVYAKHDPSLLATPMSDDPDGSVTFTINPNSKTQRPVLPFGEQLPAAISLDGIPDDPILADDDAITFVQTDDIKSNTLPFVRPQEAAPERITNLPPPPTSSSALPFAPRVPPPVAPALPFIPKAAQPPPVPPHRPPTQPPPRDLPFFSPLGLTRQPDSSVFPAPVAPPPAPSKPALVTQSLPDAPAMIGPIATLAAAPVVASSVDTTQAQKEPTPEDYPIERCARMAASIARRKNDRDKILEAEKIDEANYTRLQTHWNEAISAELERGKTQLLKKFDAAYIERLEEERGPILPDEFARIVVASERGNASRTLNELGLPETALIRIERVFLGRTVRDSDFAQRVRHAIETERDA